MLHFLYIQLFAHYSYNTQVFCHEYNLLPPNGLRLLPNLYYFAFLPYLLVIISFRAKLNSSIFFQVHFQVQCPFFYTLALTIVSSSLAGVLLHPSHSNKWIEKGSTIIKLVLIISFLGFC